MTDSTAYATGTTYRGPAEAGAPRLSGLPGVSTTVTEEQQVLETERWDTDDLRLASAGVELALHCGPDEAHWELRLPDGGDQERLRVPAVLPDVEGADPDGPPGELDELLRGTRKDRAVRPVGRLRTVRVTTTLLGDDNRPLAVLVRDDVTLATFGSSTTLEGWTEVEVRPLPGGGELGSELAARVRATGVRPAAPAGPTALTRLLTPAPKRRRAGRKGSAGAVLMDYVGAQADRIAEQDRSVRRDEPDAVHRMRVAARRLRAALQAYRPLLDSDRVRPLIVELRRLGQVLAPARDAEVRRERILSQLDATELELTLGPVQAQVTRHFARAEAEARAAVLAELDGDRYTSLRQALDDLVADPPLTRRATRSATSELPRQAARTARKLKKAVAAAIEADDTRRDAALHEARKKGKRLRYATEVARPAVGKPAKRFGRGLKRMHHVLGEHQDAVVARGVLRELGAQAHAAGENGFTFGLLLGRDTERAHRLEARFPRVWEQAWRKKTRRWLTA